MPDEPVAPLTRKRLRELATAARCSLRGQNEAQRILRELLAKVDAMLELEADREQAQPQPRRK